MKTVGSYRLERELGEGGMGKVYQARHPTLGIMVAIKELAPYLAKDAQFRQRFLQEAQAQARLSHPYIVEVKDLIEEDSGAYLVMDYMPGGSLEEVIAKSPGPVDPDWALPRMRQALSALDFAHQRGVIHRDVKPSNILLDAGGNAKVTDFGIAIVLGSRRLTMTGTMLGTPQYMSPEQIITPKQIDHRADVYSMGVVLYELLTGRVPFEGETAYKIQDAHVKEPPPPLRQLNPSIPEALERVVLKALAKEPEERFAGCGELGQALDQAFLGAPAATQRLQAPIPAPTQVAQPSTGSLTTPVPPTQVKTSPSTGPMDTPVVPNQEEDLAVKVFWLILILALIALAWMSM